jgi:pimeloyl-ACP methyl ester carboxylesterase
MATREGEGGAALPPGVRARRIANVNGLDFHCLEAGFETPGRPCLLLLHGFPELAYSWRKVMMPLAQAGYHVLAPDQRGYGETTGWDADFVGDFASFRILNIVRDALGLVHTLGYSRIAGVVGHDFGATIAAWCALIRPDIFRSLVMMSAPFGGPPDLRAVDGDGAAAGPILAHWAILRDALAALDPPRKHYQWYFSSPEANADMMACPQGVAAFLRAYFHCKSADWRGNQSHRLAAWSASEMAKMPRYYIMDKAQNMPATVAAMAPTEAEIRSCAWLTEEELGVYADAFSRTGFQGGLQWYRCRLDRRVNAELELFSGRTIDAPSLFIAGESDWGVYQAPGAFERMNGEICTQMAAAHLIPGAGHWVQQERPLEVVARLLEFFAASAT